MLRSVLSVFKADADAGFCCQRRFDTASLHSGPPRRRASTWTRHSSVSCNSMRRAANTMVLLLLLLKLFFVAQPEPAQEPAVLADENFVRTFIDTQAVGCNHVAETVLNEGSRRALVSSPLDHPQAAVVGVGGQFVICANCTDAAAVYWLDPKHVLHHIAQCSMCGRNLCSKLTKLSPDQKAKYTAGSQFSCGMAHFPPPPPPPVPPPPSPPRWIKPGQSRPPTYECCSKAHPTFGCDWTGVNDFIDASGSLPDVVPYTRKTYGGWPGDPSWMAAGCEIPCDPAFS